MGVGLIQSQELFTTKGTKTTKVPWGRTLSRPNQRIFFVFFVPFVVKSSCDQLLGLRAAAAPGPA
jgi:hypothetical protein